MKMKCREEKKGKGKQESSDSIRKENEEGIEEEHH